MKVKRAAIRPIIDGLRHRFHVSVAEVDYLDQWQRSAIGVALVSNSASHVQEVIDEIERFVFAAADVELLATDITWLEPETA